MNIRDLAGPALMALATIGVPNPSTAQVVGGGATLPEDLYNDDILVRSPLPGFSAYVGVGSGLGKAAFFNNDPVLLDPTGLVLSPGTTVDYAGSDSLVTAIEEDAYNAHPTFGAASYGALIQIPTALTSVAVPYNITGYSAVNLTSAQLASIFADPMVVRWNQIPGFEFLPGNRLIKVIYRSEGSGTSEIFLRHLNAVNPALVAAFRNTFASVVNVSNTSKYIAATGDDGVVAALAAHPDSITYVSPDKVAFNDPTQVVAITRTIGGVTQNLLPPDVNITNALTDIDPPTGASALQARNWGIGFVASGSSPLANPVQGYPIVGATNLIFSQCYESLVDATRIRQLLSQHYAPGSTVNDAMIAEHSFFKLPENWRSAIFNAFFGNDSVQRIGNPDVCTGVGRPA
ncbi:substrate-binding domain-containing protein [Achromobacter pestifer]|uniref:Alkaline phosphatase L n=1 Tax=Achromobacter pestifer TaxID=1353889 RepID=A0A6S6YWD9_9BURK|nr:substrate-binding domain-containing protein [Achromobacter pestifer]CAB3647097.1 Alkaline phosphatase L [Achromobacter pestifer]